MAPDERDRDDETGQFTKEYPPDDFVVAIEANGGATGTKDGPIRVVVVGNPFVQEHGSSTLMTPSRTS